MTPTLLARIEAAEQPSRELFLDVLNRIILTTQRDIPCNRYVQLLSVEAFEQAALLLLPTFARREVKQHADGSFSVWLTLMGARLMSVCGTHPSSEANATLLAILRASEVAT